MPLTHAGTCAFLNEERLCGIQKHFGAAKLSAACSTYPRESVERFGHMETALNLSCPEAARLTLFDPELLGPGFSPSELPQRFAAIIADAESLPAGYEPLLALRELILLMLADRSHHLADRLHRLGSLAAALQSLAETAGVDAAEWLQHNPQRLARLLARLLTRRHAAEAPCSARQSSASHSAAASSPSFPCDVPRPPVSAFFPESPSERFNTVRQLHFALVILRQRLAESPVLPRLRECLEDFEQGLHLDLHGVAIHPATVERYEHASRAWLMPWLERHPYLLENLAINHVFKYHYPFCRQLGNSRSLVENHAFLCTQIALLQTLLVGTAAHYEDRLQPAHVIKVVQTLARAIEHRPATLAAMAAFAGAHGLNKNSELTSLLELPGCREPKQTPGHRPSTSPLPPPVPSSCVSAWALAADTPGAWAESLRRPSRPAASSAR
jgi:lysine-N-methylase